MKRADHRHRFVPTSKVTHYHGSALEKRKIRYWEQVHPSLSCRMVTVRGLLRGKLGDVCALEHYNDLVKINWTG